MPWTVRVLCENRRREIVNLPKLELPRLVRSTTILKQIPAFLREAKLVPNDQSDSDFLRENPFDLEFWRTLGLVILSFERCVKQPTIAYVPSAKLRAAQAASLATKGLLVIVPSAFVLRWLLRTRTLRDRVDLALKQFPGQLLLEATGDILRWSEKELTMYLFFTCVKSRLLTLVITFRSSTKKEAIVKAFVTAEMKLRDIFKPDLIVLVTRFSPSDDYTPHGLYYFLRCVSATCSIAEVKEGFLTTDNRHLANPR